MNLMANLLKIAGFKAAIRFAKISLVLVGIASAVLVPARLAAPYCFDLLSSSLPGAWIAIQLIIVIVWKLSRRQLEEDTPPYIPPLLINQGDLETLPDVLNPPSEILHSISHYHEIPGGVPPKSVSSTPATVLNSGEPPPEQSSNAQTDSGVKKSRVPSPSPESVRLTEEEDAGDSMDATWRAILDGGAAPTRPILRKSDTWESSPRATAAAAAAAAGRELMTSATFREEGWRGRAALVVSREELLGRVEAFIEMHYDHLRLQREESEQRRFTEMVNHAY